MAREPAITFRGALRILGHYDRPWLDRLDRLLGGAILASGAAPAVGAVWGWVDQKNEAAGLLRRALDAVSGRLTRTGGLARHELVVAAHTTLVLAAFFDTLHGWLGQQFDEAAFTEAEKVMLGTGKWQQEGEPLVRHLYAADVPSPSVIRGFHENVTEVHEWAWRRSSRVVEFLEGIGLELQHLDAAFARTVTERYRSDYLTLATTVPEFKVWADLGEHAATRTALARLAELLSHSTTTPRDLCALLGEINRAELSRPVIDVDIDGYGIDAVFPTVERIFLTPRFRITTADRSDRIGDEHWWEHLNPGQDLDVALARHFSTPDSTCLPLLLLGHPGAGKSLLMKVLAARLPESTYTVVRVPLRRVDADTNISTQIQQALDAATNGRVSWPDLADQSADTIRVILLDGLDELLQATTNDRAGYLTDIVEFQRIEAAMGKPVAVVVTSRTLVAERVRVPEGTPVLKLEDFDEYQIQEWLRIWNEVNGGTHPVTLESVMAQEDLARQPLLLLMLTLYFADPDVARTDVHLSTLELYQRLFDTYARREVTKQAGKVLKETKLREAVQTQLSRLSIAAMGMFNRGRQSVTEAELSADLAALDEPAPGGRLLGEFFFVHAPEATAGEVHRGYEFMHATFAEYLVATKVVETLADVAEGAYRRRRFHEPDDELLFALLSHQPLAIQRPTLDFIADHFARMGKAERTDVRQTLELLIRAYRHRRMSTRYTDYRPQSPDVARALAAYSANLVLLRVDHSEVKPTTLWPDDPTAWWATVNLWAAGLDAEGYRAMLATIGFSNGRIHFEPSMRPHDGRFNELMAARLRGDREAEKRLRFGHAACDGYVYFGEPETWEERALSGLLAQTVGNKPDFFDNVPEHLPLEATARIGDVAYSILGIYCMRWGREYTERFLRWLMRLYFPAAPLEPFALVERFYPGMVDSLRAEPDEKWARGWQVLLESFPSDNLERSRVVAAAEYLKIVTPDKWTLSGYRPDH